MIANLNPYPAMKDSGVPWLGEVPEHWDVAPLGRYLRVKSGDMISADEERSDGVPIYGGNGVRGYTYKSNTEGPVLLLGRVGAKCGCVHLVGGKLWASEHALRVIPQVSINLSFFARLLVHSDLNQYAIRTAQPLINSTIVRTHRVTVAPNFEQASIVRFLDHYDRKIRRYIRAKQKLIKLLEGEKQAIILRAVTRGLHPNVPLKPSGVEWLGEVPEHWEVRRNGRVFAQRNETGFADLPILEVSLRTGVRIRDFENSVRKQVMSDRDKYKRAVSGDIAYNMMRMWQGAVGVAPTDGLISPAYIVAKPLTGTESRYFIRLFRTAVYMAEVDKYSRGIVKDRNRLYWEDFKQMPSCYPPTHEQVMIADSIDHACTHVNAAIDRTRREIELLREYRTRLIADIVTGKLDVREAAELLPTEIEDLKTLEEADVPTDEEADAVDNLDAISEEVEV